MSVAAIILKRIKYMPKGRPFSSERFAEVGSRAAVDKAVSRMVAAGALERVTRGVYMRPKISPFAGVVRPSANSVVEVVAKHNRETIQIHGAEAVRQLNLSTQMQTRPVFYTSGSSRELRFGKTIVQFQHVSQEKLQCAGTKAGMALVAMFYLGREGLSSEILERIKSKLTSVEFKRLTACTMPAWMQSAVRQVM
jgi:hypothetical protein